MIKLLKVKYFKNFIRYQSSTGFDTTVKFIETSINKLRPSEDIDILPAVLDWNYLLNKENLTKIETNNKNRKGLGDIRLVHKLYDDIKTSLETEKQVDELIKEIYKQACKIPNKSHELAPVGDYDKSICVLESGVKIEKKTPTIDKIARLYGWLREEQIGLFSTPRAYILKKELADLETALVRYTLDYLKNNEFILVSVPDILHHSIIESCGFATKGPRSQVYKLDYLNEYGKFCMSGTSEMALAGLVKNKIFNENELPLKLCASSRCFRAEVSGSEREGKLYRLHEFTKVEMFFITEGKNEISDKTLEEIKNHQIELFSGLGIHFKVLNMSTQELGSPAYRKYDIEAWMPGKQFYGEISSTSNCTDFQSRRLNIRSSQNKQDHSLKTNFVHTLNGTACAIPRMLTCIVESNWDLENNCLKIPNRLKSYMKGKDTIKVPIDFRKAEIFRK